MSSIIETAGAAPGTHRLEGRVEMKKGWIVIVLCGLAAAQAPQLLAQFTAEELAQRPQWEEFLATAKEIAQQQITGAEDVTSPWKLTLQLGDVTHNALWKNARGRMGGYIWNRWWTTRAPRAPRSATSPTRCSTAATR